VFILPVIVLSNCRILQFLHQLFNVSALLLDDALKPATPLIAPIKGCLCRFATISQNRISQTTANEANSLSSIIYIANCRPFERKLRGYVALFMVALWNRTDHYIFILSFVLLSSFFLLFSLPNLSRRILDVCHTTTYGVALVQI